jgi:transposase-like protein
MAGTKPKTKITPELKARAVEMVTTYESAEIVAEHYEVPVRLVRKWKFAALQAMGDIMHETIEKLDENDRLNAAEERISTMYRKFLEDLILFFGTIPESSVRPEKVETPAE